MRQKSTTAASLNLCTKNSVKTITATSFKLGDKKWDKNLLPLLLLIYVQNIQQKSITATFFKVGHEKWDKNY